MKPSKQQNINWYAEDNLQFAPPNPHFDISSDSNEKKGTMIDKLIEVIFSPHDLNTVVDTIKEPSDKADIKFSKKTRSS